MFRRGITPVVAIVLLLMMTVAAAGGAYTWFSQIQAEAQQNADTTLNTGLAVKDVNCLGQRVHLTLKNSGDADITTSSANMYLYQDGTLVETVDVGRSDAPFGTVGDLGELKGNLSTFLTPGTSYTVEVAFTDADYSLRQRCTGEQVRSCRDLYEAGFDSNGTYQINPDASGGVSPFTAYCDMDSDGGGWTLATMWTADTPADLFRSTTATRLPSNGNVSTDLTLAGGDWYNHLRWGPATGHSTAWSVVDYPVYNRQSDGTSEWFDCTGTGSCADFSPRLQFKCSWEQTYTTVQRTSRTYKGFRVSGWNLQDYDESGNNWEGALPGTHLGSGHTLSDTKNMNGYDCNPSDNRKYKVQLWVR